MILLRKRAHNVKESVTNKLIFNNSVLQQRVQHSQAPLKYVVITRHLLGKGNKMDKTHCHWVSFFLISSYSKKSTTIRNTNKTFALLVTYLKNIDVKRKN